LFTVILAMLFLKERMNWWQWAGMGLGLFGSVLLATNGLRMFGVGTFEGNMLVMFSAITYAFATIFGKRLLGRNKPSTVVGWSNIIGAVLLFPPALVEGCPIPATSSAWLDILGLALLSSFIAYVLWYKVMEYTPVSRLIVTIYLIPVIATGLSIWWLGERLDAMQALYAALILAGVAIAQKTTEKKGPNGDLVEKRDIRRNG
jgi:drug/metabolite transporter (DMT)-like permease